MEDFDETLYVVWRSNLNVLAGSPAGGARIARMMSFSPSHMKLILAGRRDFSEEFIRGVETVTGLPPRWMDDRHDGRDIPPETQRAMDEEAPAAVFRGNAHPAPKRPVLRGPEPLLSQTEATRRIADQALQQGETLRRDQIFRRNRDLLLTDLRRVERQLSMVQLDSINARAEDMGASGKLDGPVRADLAGRIEQIDKHRAMLMQHVEKLATLLTGLED
ncbi:hypothetical protein AX768_23685 [Burkholderia sp. PAMC 28687]|jgi:hypothetical protein|uniref:hypothetical protein n=1 Tax=Burkholderia sp. PAMC 28687 TaxID=1795874 RepID=UPI0007838A40|nr:hypothetical protein [Burkholderia sp. PAMC 28687]AMM17242.1 hypothetical protein AX768_23685 [Burkholderia sp. PAMC 28687]